MSAYRLRSTRKMMFHAKRFISAHDIVFRLRIKPGFRTEFVNSVITDISGYTPDDYYNNPRLHLETVHPDYLPVLLAVVNGEYDFSQPMEIKWFAKDGHVYWTETMLTLVVDDKGDSYVIDMIWRDITRRKLHEEQLQEMAHRDMLTRLFNRAFITEEAQKCAVNGIPTGFIICDIDHLKFINDACGHHYGDALIVATAKCIKDAIPEYPLIGRTGGDEFAVLIPCCSQDDLDSAVTRLINKQQGVTWGSDAFPLSFSVGSSIWNTEKTIDETYREADNMMYLNKLKNSQKVHEQLTESLFKLLETHGIYEVGHSCRTQRLAVALGKYIGLDQTKLKNLDLASQFHDLGKVRMPENILYSTSTLSPSEMELIKRHSEIGYRIAVLLPTLSPVADLILKHHESWDGSGYPLGLSREEIPLESRINLVADAYDAMTNDRPYRKAMTHQEAVAELVRCAGTQFDPTVVNAFLALYNDLDACIPAP